jgi:Ca2+-dependent lipid-binding protein
MDPSRFRNDYRDCTCHVTVRNALNLTGGGLFDKLDPYTVVRFRGSKFTFRTSTLEDAGSDPFWACKGCRHQGKLLYQGETAIEISVWDFDRHSKDDLIATGVIPVEQFCRGFEGCVPLNLPEGKKRKANMKQMMIVMGVQFDPPKEPFALADRTGGFGKSTTLRSAAAASRMYQTN